MSDHFSEFEDLSVAAGSFVCVEYVERHPHMLANPGMASRIINYFRLPGEDTSTASVLDKNDPTALEAGLKVGGGRGDEKMVDAAIHPRLRGSIRLPRHLRFLQDGRRRFGSKSLEQDIDIPKLPEGQTVSLEAGDESPFLGDIEKGCIQPSICNNLFQAPLFPHTPKRTDFLLVALTRSACASTLRHKGDPSGVTRVPFALRALPSNGFFLCGQQEPQRIVPRPLKKLSKFQEDWTLLHITRFFENLGDRTTYAKSILGTSRLKQGESRPARMYSVYLLFLILLDV